MAFNPPKGPGKGPGNGKPRNTFKPGTTTKSAFTGETGKAAVEKKLTMREKFAAWTAANPEAQKSPETLSQKATMAILETEILPEAADRVLADIKNKRSPQGGRTAVWVMERVVGKAPQAVELSAPGGGPVAFTVSPERAAVAELIAQALPPKPE